MESVYVPDVIEFSRLNREAHSLVVTACLRFLNASHHVFPQKTREVYHETVIRQRDSALYRYESLGFHLSLLGTTLEKYQRLAEEPQEDQRQGRANLRAAATEAIYLTDDLVFNAASMFDYWAGLVATMFAGPQKHSTKWNQLVRLISGMPSATASSGERFLRESSTAERMLALHRSWVDALFSYRSDVIHTSAERPDGSVVRRWTPEPEVHVVIPLPEKLRRKMAFLHGGTEEGKGLALLGAARLYMRCFYALADLSLSLASDVHDHFGPWHPTARFGRGEQPGR